MDNMLDSECSSVCESGWTLYLEQSLPSPYPSQRITEKQSVTKDEDGEEQEDSSMVSDASSGPPIFDEYEFFGNTDNGFFYHAVIDASLPKNRSKKEKNRENRRPKVEEDDPSFLDDTASSPLFDFSLSNFTVTHKETSIEHILDISQGCSSTHFKRKSAFDEPFGFFQFSLSGNQFKQNRWFGGKMGIDDEASSKQCGC